MVNSNAGAVAAILSDREDEGLLLFFALPTVPLALIMGGDGDAEFTNELDEREVELVLVFVFVATFDWIAICMCVCGCF
jgi:hypothetical protein